MFMVGMFQTMMDVKMFIKIIGSDDGPIVQWFRTLPCHGRDTGSNPVGTAKKLDFGAGS